MLVEGRVLPDPEAAAGLRDTNSIEVEQYAAGIQRQLTAHIRWIQLNRATDAR